MSGIGGFPKPGGGGSGLTASEFMQTVLDDADPAEARNTLQIAEIDLDPVNRLVSGGGVVWESGYTFRVSAATYYINGTLVESAEQTVTLAAADPTNPRIDVLVLDDAGLLDDITGTPSATASEPDIDPTQQLRLTFVLVDAASTAPVGVSNETVYAENVEWTTSTSGAGFNANSTSNPYAGTTCVEGTDVATGATVAFARGSDMTLAGDAVLVMRIRSKAAWGKNRALRLQWFDGAVAVGAAVTLGDGFWGFDSSATSGYQLVAIPVAQFGTAAGAVVDGLRITCARGTMGFYLDGIVLQESGGSIGTPPNNYLTQDEADARYLRSETPVAVAGGGTGASTAAGARANLSAAALSQTGEQISGFIASPSDKSYTIALKMAHPGTITETTTISASGTCTATFKVNTTALGGTANSVSSAEQSQAHASANTFAAGDDIVLTVSANSSCADMSFTIKYTRTLA